MTASDESAPVNTGAPTVGEVTVKVTIPLELEVPEGAEMVSVAPREEVSVTFFPETGFELRSLRVTVMVEAVDPFAATEIGLAVTDD